MRLILVAAPGAGKSQQSKMIVSEFGLTYFSSGMFFRDYFGRENIFQGYKKEDFDRGILCSDDIVNSMVKISLPFDNYLLDGYPRTLPQVEFLDEDICKNGIDYRVIHLDVPLEVCRERLVRRGSLEARSDDQERVIIDRLNIYERLTGLVVEHYRARGLLIETSGLGSIEDVSSRLREKIKTYKDGHL